MIEVDEEPASASPDQNVLLEALIGEDIGVADFINKSNLKDDIVCVNTQKMVYYVWNSKSKLWDMDIGGIIVMDMIGNFLKEKITDVIINLNMEMKSTTGNHLVKMLEAKIKEFTQFRKSWTTAVRLRNFIKVLTGNQRANKDFEPLLNSKRHLLSVKNGVIDLRTGVLRERQRDDMLSYELASRYDPKVEYNPDGVLGSFLSSIFQDKKKQNETIEWLQRYLGCCISGEVKDQVFCLWLGDKGGNGKGVLMSLLSSILGKERYTDISSSDVLVGARDDSQKKLFGKCIGKSIAVIDEISDGDRLKAGLIKKMAGLSDDTIVNCNAIFQCILI